MVFGHKKEGGRRSLTLSLALPRGERVCPKAGLQRAGEVKRAQSTCRLAVRGRQRPRKKGESEKVGPAAQDPAPDREKKKGLAAVSSAVASG